MKQTLSKEEILKAFQQLVSNYRLNKDRIATKEEQARKEENRQLVETVSSHTPKSIVKGLADLQLDFGAAVEKLVEQANSELEKLNNLRAAIGVQEKALRRSSDTKVAANALYVLQQEQQQRLQKLEEDHKETLERLAEEIESTRAEWAKEQAEFDANEAERKANLEKDRNKEIEEYKYQLERTYKVEKDQYDQDKLLLERELAESQKEKEKDWAGREKELAENNEEFEKHKAKVDGFEEELEKATKSARDKAMQQASKECKEEMELFEKEVEAKKRMANLRIDNLKQTIDEQKAEIERLIQEVAQAQAEVRSMSLSALGK